MDVFAIGKSFGTLDFYATLDGLVDTLSKAHKFLSDVEMEVLTRIAPMRFVAPLFTPSTKKLCNASSWCDELPGEYRKLIRICDMKADDGGVVRDVQLCVAEVLVVLLQHNNHYSALVLDMVGREAHHYDSFPECGHAVRADAAAANLHALGVLVSPLVMHRVAFVQPRTECGMYVMMLMGNLENRLAARPMHEDRSVTIEAAMEESCAPEAVSDVRFNLMLRARSAFLVLYNAHPETTAPESQAQQAVLGPLCNRVSLRALCKHHEPTRAQVFAALNLMVPGGIEVITHDMATGSDVIGDAAFDRIATTNYVLFFLSRTSTPDTVDAAFLMLFPPPDAGSTRPLLFLPRTPLSRAVAHTAMAIVTRFNARRVEINTAGFSRTDSTVALPMLLLSWWGARGIGVPQDEIDRELSAAVDRVSIDTLRQPDKGCDWMFRQMLAAAMNDAFHRLSHTEKAAAADDQSGRNMPDEDALDAVRVALGKAVVPVDRAKLTVCMRSEYEAQQTAELGKMIDLLYENARTHAPPRWNISGGATELRQLYYYMVRIHLYLERVVDSLNNVVQCARRVSASMDSPSSAHILILPLLDMLLNEWPFMMIGQPQHNDNNIAVTPMDDEYAFNVERMLMQKEGDPVPLVLCPVMILDDAGVVNKVISMSETVSLLQAKKLTTAATVGLADAGPYVGITALSLGGSRDGCFAHAAHHSIELSDTDQAHPTFISPDGELRLPCALYAGADASVGSTSLTFSSRAPVPLSALETDATETTTTPHAATPAALQPMFVPWSAHPQK